MLKKVVLICIGLLLPANFLASSEGPKLPSVIKVGCERGWGSGVFISSNEILTAAHVVNGCFNEGLDLRVMDTWEIIVIDKLGEYDEGVDLALGHIEKGSGKAVPIAKAPEALGSDLYIIGYPGPDGFLVVTKGIVSGQVENYLVTDARCYFGNSGGAVINESGELIGILVATDTLGLCFAMDLPTIYDFLGEP